MSDEDYKRRNDAVIARVEQKLDDHIAEESVRQQHIERFFKETIDGLKTEIEPLKKAYRVIETPARWIGWTVVITLSGALLWIGEKTMVWLSRHVH